jgi:hypothetical protein
MLTIHVPKHLLNAGARWVGWKQVAPKRPGGKPRKVPIDPHTGRAGSSTDPATWSTLDHARKCQGGRVGFTFIREDDIGGVDLDGCRDPATGKLTDWAWEIIERFNSYTEISPTGTGVKIFSRSAPAALEINQVSMPGPRIAGKPPQIEAYVSGRYFTFTGQQLEGMPSDLNEAPEAWAWLAGEMRRRTKETPSGDAPKAASEGFDRARLFQALGFIKAEDRATWLRVGMCLHHATAGGEEGFDLWCAWSLNAPGKFDGQDQRRTWESFGKRQTGVTERTLYQMAREGGWSDRATAEEDFERLAKPSLVVLEAEDLLTRPAPPRRSLVPGWLPLPEVSLFGADGGGGKTTIAMQLAYSCACRAPWLGMDVNPGPVVYLSAEEPEDDLHVRLEHIAKHYSGKLQPKQWALVSKAGQDATLALFDRDGTQRPTPLFNAIGNLAAERKARLIVLESVADVFGGDESDRRHVRTFIGLLRNLALRCDAAVLLTAHPSVDGIKTGRGYSGSTHWNNAVRSRLYLTAPASAEGEIADPDLRCLTLAKTNRGRPGEKIMLRWNDGIFAPGMTAHGAAEAKAVFLMLLQQYFARGRYLTENFAPGELAADPGAQGFSKKALQRAMKELLADGEIETTYDDGPPSKRRKVLAPKGAKIIP